MSSTSDELEAKVVEATRPRMGMSSLMTILAATAMLGGGLPSLPHPGSNPTPRNTDNSPTRAKGMRPFDIDGVIIYSGTLKGAMKKARLLKAQSPAPDERP